MKIQDFPKEGLVRLNEILAPAGPIPVSKSTWWKGVKDGIYPQRKKLGPRITVWRVKDIREMFEWPDDDEASLAKPN